MQSGGRRCCGGCSQVNLRFREEPARIRGGYSLRLRRFIIETINCAKFIASWSITVTMLLLSGSSPPDCKRDYSTGICACLYNTWLFKTVTKWWFFTVAGIVLQLMIIVFSTLSHFNVEFIYAKNENIYEYYNFMHICRLWCMCYNIY